jgi:peptide deformylase
VLELSTDEQDGPEGCLSIPGLAFETTRALSVVAAGQNMWGEPVVLEGTQLLARCVQHETDHLDGILFVDRLDPEARREAMRAIREAEWFADNPPEVRISPHSTFGRAM